VVCSTRIASTVPVWSFGVAVARSESTAIAGGVGVALAAPAAGGPVGAVDLDNPDVLRGEIAGQGGAVGPGALDPNAQQDPEPAQPGQQGPVPGRGGGVANCSGVCECL
jgi:hypothetical protein